MIKPILLKTYLGTVSGSVGTDMFRHSWAEVDGVEKDITQDGELSCALFVSSILKIFDLIETRHATVSGTIRDLEESGWVKTEELKPGNILVWESQSQSDNQPHRHLGFFLEGNKAISNSFKERTPQIHHLTYGDTRQLESIYWHPRLDF